MSKLPQSIRSIAEAINEAAQGRPIGQLQSLRQRLRGTTRTATKAVFARASMHDEYAFHSGGRSELQFNIGIEDEVLRYGVALSFEPSRSLPNVSILFPKVARFNDYLTSDPSLAADLWMRHKISDRLVEPYRPRPIPPELARPGVFIFLGAREPRESTDIPHVLDTMDRLLPLYEYVERRPADDQLAVKSVPFTFVPGCTTKSGWASATLAERVIDINLRHNRIQELLYAELVREHGAESVGAENISGTGGRIDMVVQVGARRCFYEIKTALTARACIRAALSQLLEYAFWRGSKEADELVVVGAPVLDEDAAAYLRTLRERFAIPIEYRRVRLEPDAGRE